MAREKNVPTLEIDQRLLLAVLNEPNDAPGVGGDFTLQNLGGEPEIGTLYIDSNPGELSQPVYFLYEQTGAAVLKRGTPPNAVYEAFFEPIQVPTPRTFQEIIKKMNEGQFLQLGPNDKGVCVVPRGRRSAVLEFLGFKVK